MYCNSELFNEADFQIMATKMKYLSSGLTSYEELFRDFDELRVITYSYGLNFVRDIVKKFSYAEMIVGNSNLIDKNLAEIMLHQKYPNSFGNIIYNQKYVCDYIRENDYLIERVRNGSFRIFTPQELCSHEKLYLLHSDDGRTRVIFGSANFSSAAWKNQQLENISYCDDQEAYEYYISRYEILKDMSMSEISLTAFEAKTDEAALEELPIFQVIKAKEAVVIKSEARIESNTVLKTNNLNSQIFDTLKKVKLSVDKQGHTIVEAKDVRVLFNELKAAKKVDAEKLSVYPQLVLDYENKTVSFDGQEFDLNPSKEEIAKNISDLKRYFDGFDDCIEDEELSHSELYSLKRDFWKILNYMFLSPLLAYFRYFVNKYGYEETTYPIYLIINGNSGIGKTTFIQSVQKLMLNTIPAKKYVARNIKKAEFESFKICAKGAPILIDEMDNERWAKLKNTVKADDCLFEQGNINHPCFILPSNNITFLDKDIQRRVIFFKINISLDETKSVYKSREIKQLQQEFTNALYCEYLRIMFEKMESLIEEMANKNILEKWIPDIYRESVETLHSIFTTVQAEIPSEFEIFDIDSYKGNFEKLDNAKRILIETYNSNREIFEVQKNRNILQINFTCYNNDYKNNKNAKILYRDLPRSFKCEQHGMKLTMSLSEFTKLTGIKIKRGLFH